MKFQDALENSRSLINTLLLVIALLFCSNIALIWALHETQSTVRVYIPPRVPASGITTTSGQVPKSTVFSFAYWVWQSINYWPKNGANDYTHNIKSFLPYLTPKFQVFLENDDNTRFSNDEVQDRIRTMMGVNGSSFSPADVEYVGHGTWLVHLTMRLTERMNTDGSVIKDAEISYELRVVKYNADPKSNPYGLALAGFAVSPKRIKTYV